MDLVFRVLSLLLALPSVLLFTCDQGTDSETICKFQDFRNLNEIENLKPNLVLYRSYGEITKNNVARLDHVESITLIDCNITKIEDGALCSSKNLKRLSFENTSSDLQFTSSVFENCQGITSLKLDANIVDIYKPFKHFKNLKTVELSGIDWIILKKTALRKFENVEDLTIANFSKLETISHNAFDDIKNLIELKIVSNPMLQSLERHPFKNLQKLKILDLSNNNIQILHWKSLAGLIKLKEFRFSGNGFMDFDKKETLKHIQKFTPKLRKIHLSIKQFSDGKKQRKVSRALGRMNIEVVWVA